MGLCICFKGKQLERRGAKQSNEKICIKENSGIRVAMCSLFKMYIYNLNHHNHLQHSSLENIFTKGHCTTGTHASACNHYCHTPNFPTFWLMLYRHSKKTLLLIDVQKATRENTPSTGFSRSPCSVRALTPGETETGVMWMLWCPIRHLLWSKLLVWLGIHSSPHQLCLMSKQEAGPPQP